MAKKESIREKIHNFNSDMEFCIYKDLCTSKDPKKSDMKKMEGIRFKTYDEYIHKKEIRRCTIERAERIQTFFEWQKKGIRCNK